MSGHYPRIRIHAESGYLLIRDGLTLTFYMRRAHAEVAPAVLRALGIYRSMVGPNALGLYTDAEGNWHELDDAGWDHVRREILSNQRFAFHLTDASTTEDRYRFRYHGKPLNDPSLGNKPGAVSAVSFWLPTEYLEEHGPDRVRALAIEIAALLPFCSGHAGLSFNCETDLVGVKREVRKLCFRYPGMDIPELGYTSWEIGTRVRGPAWLTFLGQPVLGELGGVENLRARLRSPETTVQDMGAERAVIILGPWPEAGDAENGRDLPAYRELARVLEPWLFHEKPLRGGTFTPEDLLRWERRFLD
ncbi:DUF3396 domain-containing protein [Archangium lipolyticum]|uniref:DUF3396 domain-containing protein n=1 Tax=Archangium lipolyticum TaxID=2970465 RepID=UPI00214A00B2|nr:DUF3396 domain-containing protein [Archangium lipolyticum]